MRKLLTFIVIAMFLATMFITARSGDQYNLKDRISWQNGVYISGVMDGSYFRDNSNDPNDNFTSAQPNGKQSAHYYEEETGDIRGITFIDEFRNSVKIPGIVWLHEAIKYELELANRFYAYVRDRNIVNPQTGVAGANVSADGIFGAITFLGIYRSYFTQKWIFGGDPVKYELGFDNQVRIYFDSTNGIDNFRWYPHLQNKVTIAKILEIQLNNEWMFRWHDTAAAPMDGNITVDFRIGSVGMAGGGYHVVGAAARRAVGYTLGPVSLGWRLRTRHDIATNFGRIKDTNPGGDKDEVSGDATESGVFTSNKFRSQQEIWINPLATNKNIILNIGIAHKFMIEGEFSYNNPETYTITNDVRVGAELVFSKSYIFAAFFRYRGYDFFNAYGQPLNGSAGADKVNYADADDDPDTVLTINSVEYGAIPLGIGQIGPLVYAGVNKDAFEWVIQWQGFANIRTYDVDGDNFITVDATANLIANNLAYWDWRNEIETWVMWRW